MNDQKEAKHRNVIYSVVEMAKGNALKGHIYSTVVFNSILRYYEGEGYMKDGNVQNKEQEFLSLYEAINNEIKELRLDKYCKLDDFIKDDKKSADFINILLDDNIYSDYKENEGMYNISQARARHVAITYLMGLVFWQFIENNTKLDYKKSREYKQMWLKISLYHDRGYFSEHIKNGKLKYDQIWKYDLFKDVYEESNLKPINYFAETHHEVCAYTYSEIMSYDAYAREYHESIDSDERVDHGILGAVITFNELLGKIEKDSRINLNLLEVKTVCMTVAQHNIFKSPSVKYDVDYKKHNLYKLISTSNFRINKEYPYLYILCLIDTVECVKSFSRKGVAKGEGSFNTLTVLKNISIYLQNEGESILMDFGPLEKVCLKRDKEKDNENMRNKYNKHIGGMIELSKWTTFYAKQCKNNKNIIRIFCE